VRRFLPMFLLILALPVAPAMGDIAPNGKIVFDEDLCCEYDIWVVNADGTGLTNLTNTPDVMEVDPTWSPDGTRISFTRLGEGGGDIWVMNADGGGQINLTNSPQSDFLADWSPDGAQLVFVREVPGQVISTQFDIFTMNADGTNQVNITNADTDELEPAWSPVGDRIAFAAVRNGDWEIVSTDTTGGNEVTLTVTTQEDRSPQWSPTGSMIVWMSQFDEPCCGDWEIWAMNADGSGATNLTQNPAGDWYPSWSPDGTLILFESFRESNFGELFTIPAPTQLPPPAITAQLAGLPATKLSVGSNAHDADWGSASGGPVSQLLTVSVSGTGLVSSNPAGIRCGNDCTEQYAAGTVVTLTAKSGRGTAFAGWSGACTGSGTCTVTMDAAKTVTATFGGGGGNTFLLTVDKSGTGRGNVTSSPSGITCGLDCSESYAAGTVVVLTASPRSGSTFAGWSGACTGSGTCTVSMTDVKNVVATFNPTGGTVTS
jgi:Tol biopolymer transport system component